MNKSLVLLLLLGGLLAAEGGAQVLHLTVTNELEVACGLVKRGNTTVSRGQRECWLSLWGETNADTTNGFLGTGVVLPGSSRIKMSEDSLHCWILGKARTERPLTYYAGAGWTRSGDFSSAEDWNRYLTQFGRKIQSPLRVRMEVAGN